MPSPAPADAGATARPQAPRLQRQLLAWLLGPLLLLLVADTFVSYRVALNFSQRAYDRGLAEVAREVSLRLRQKGEGFELEMTPEARRVLLSDAVDTIYFDVRTADGRMVAGDDLFPEPLGSATIADEEFFYDGVVGGIATDVPVRIVEREATVPGLPGKGQAIVRAAETQNKRNSLAREILASVILPQVLLIFIAGMVVWIGVVRGLEPLDRLQRAVAQRSSRDRSPVVVNDVPGEVEPLVREINSLLSRLDRVLTLRSRFISDAAHQLKTPVAVLQTQLEVAQREQEPERMRQSLRILERGLDRLQRLVSQLLSLARNEPEAAAVQPVALGRLDLNALALEVASDWVPEALKHHVDLGLEEAGAPVFIAGDPLRLREMLDNLVDNAVRYGREGGRVTVRVLAEPAPAIEVSDDNAAIPAEERERIFERFHRMLGTSREGSGLGLAIAQEIARIHGAAISLRAGPDGAGNTFAVSFPVPVGDAPDGTPARAAKDA